MGGSGTLALATVSTLLGVGLGVVVGMLGGYYRGVLDEILVADVDALMALPALPLAMLLLTTVGANPIYVALGIARRLHAALGARPAGRRAAAGGLRVHRRRAGPGRARAVHHLPRDAAQRLGADHRRADHPVRLRDPPRHVARASWAWAPSRRRPTGGS